MTHISKEVGSTSTVSLGLLRGSPTVAAPKEAQLLEGRNLAKFVNADNEGKTVKLAGFVNRKRVLGENLKFILLGDFTGQAQVVFEKSVASDDVLDKVDGVTAQSTVVVEGTIRKTDKTASGVEVSGTNIEVLSLSQEKLPIPISNDIEKGKGAQINFRQDWRFLDLRSSRNKLIFNTVSDFERFSRDYFYDNKLIEIHTPKIIGTASESGAELFEIKEYFGKRAFLAQSPQFYKQMAICAGFEPGVFEVGPVFRANKSLTYRHDTEFISMDVELAFIKSLVDLMTFEEKLLVEVMGKLGAKYGDDIKRQFGVEITVPNAPFPRVTMAEAHTIVRALGVRSDTHSDLSSEGEKVLGKFIKETHGSDFVFITEFPSSVRPFYHMRPPENPLITHSFDLLYNGLEITTGAQREHRVDILTQQAVEKKLDLQSIGFYLDFFRYGVPPHAGFGFGPTRMVMSLLRLSNVRETTFLHRDPKRLTP